ncbi:MAG: ribosomal protein S12 methylthiotransferase RimO [Candidatus Omnitrophica bacterium CG1_02_40_15]|nr:MAG: ribosomal protein S12 methylthiotransferase RimO [Candidatus Omnitrophica bacterium CG1_02_40_15]
MAKTVSIISLGCPRNLVDSEKLVSSFIKKGYRFQEGILNSDTVIVNTCAFIEDAKKESVDNILRAIDAKKDGNIKKIIVAGCLSERYRKELTGELKEVDEFRGVLKFNGSVGAINDRPLLTPKHYAYIKISEGCANRCTYCIIPYLKGNYKSRPIESIKKEAVRLVKNGAKEIILIGQDTSLYGVDLYRKKRLGDLLKELAKISKDVWVRLLYLHPANLDKEVIEAIRDNENICRYIDLPLEHINDRILKQMARRTNKREIIALIEYIRKEIPDAAIRTSFIVGFPGEGDREFKELASFIKETKFERLGVFKYSREEGTKAYGYKNQIPEKEKQRRFNRIMSAQQGISKKVNERFKGRVLKMLVEEKGKGYYTARTEYDAPDIDGLVYVNPALPSTAQTNIRKGGVKGKNLKIGNFYDVKITDTFEYDLIGDCFGRHKSNGGRRSNLLI